MLTIASWTKSSIEKNAGDLRDKRLLTFDQEKIVRIELAAKNSMTEFGKNNQNEWQIVKPQPYRADSLQVEELVRKLKGAQMDLGLSDEEAKQLAGNFASGAPVATAKVSDRCLLGAQATKTSAQSSSFSAPAPSAESFRLSGLARYSAPTARSLRSSQATDTSGCSR